MCDKLHPRKCTGTSSLDLDLACATGVKPPTRLGIDARGLWAALPLHKQDTDALQPADLVRSSRQKTSFSYIAHTASVLKINEDSGTAINKIRQK